MNEKIQAFARRELKKGLAQCTEDQLRIFKLMYAVDGKPDLPIDDVVDKMSAEKLDWAMQQVDRTLAKMEADTRSTGN